MYGNSVLDDFVLLVVYDFPSVKDNTIEHFLNELKTFSDLFIH